MSHYQHNINTPHFPPGVHLSHSSMTNTTLIGQDVQQRLWEKYWRRQYPVSTESYDSYTYLWPRPEMCFRGYAYGTPNIYHPSSMVSSFDQLHHFVRRRFENVSNCRGTSPCLASYGERNARVEVLEEGNSWTTNRDQYQLKEQRPVSNLIPKTVDPVTDDLDWKTFGPDLADGIAVSILDSFGLDLPVLDSSTVQSVLGELDQNLTPLKDQIQNKGNEKYFQNIQGLIDDEVQEPTFRRCLQFERDTNHHRKTENAEHGEETTSTICETKIHKSLGKRLAKVDSEDDVQGKDEGYSQGPERLLQTNSQYSNIPSSPQPPDQIQQSASENIIDSPLEQPLQRNRERNLKKQKNEAGRKINATLNNGSINAEDSDKFTIKQLCPKDGNYAQRSEASNELTDQTGKQFCSLDESKVDKKNFSQDFETDLNTNLYKSDSQILMRSSDDEAEVSSSIPDTLGAGRVQRTQTQSENSSFVLNTTSMTMKKEKSGADQRNKSTLILTPDGECRSEATLLDNNSNESFTNQII